MALRVCLKYNSVLYSTYIGWLIDKLWTPSPPHPLAHPQTAPIGIGIRCRGGQWVRKRVCGGREWRRPRQSATLCRSRVQNYTCGKRTVLYSYSLYTVFHSVISNSVIHTMFSFVYRSEHEVLV